MLFLSNSLKVSVLCDMNSEKTFYYSLIWKKFSENASIVWYKLGKCVVLFASYSLKMSVLLDVWKSAYYCLAVNSSKC